MLFILSFLGTCTVMGQENLWPLGRWVSKERKKTVEIEIFQGANKLFYGRMVSENGKPTKDTGLFIKELREGKKAGQFTGLLTPPGSWFDLELTMYEIDRSRAELIAGRFGMVKRIKLTRKS